MQSNIKNFYDLDAWKEGHELVINIYGITKSFPSEEKFGITSQLKRAASSITANIAEGFERYHFNDKIRFYYQARGSFSEVQNFLILSRDLKFIEEDVCIKMLDKCNSVGRLINGLIRSIENQK